MSSTPKLVYDEWYGELTYVQRATYRKHNVPPAMHDSLLARFGNDPTAIVAFVKQCIADHGRIDYGDVLDFYPKEITA